jgi:dienelactone hydrolase
MTIRALFRAAKVESAAPPYDTLHLKVFYPARPSGSDQEQNMGIVPANGEQAPFKVVIFFNGINCGPEIYQWLAIALAERGMVVVTFSWVGQNIPGMVALTPGIDLAMFAPGAYGSGPTATAMPAILNVLQELQHEGVLAGLLDLQHIVIGGHSAGGRAAIESASAQFFPQVAGAFGYGVHTAAVTQLGYEPGTILPLPDNLPLLLMGGTQDGVIAKSSFRYGVEWETPTTPVERTFQEAIAGGRNDSYLLLLDGANHFSIAHPFDETTGRPFLDFSATQPEAQIRALMAEAIGLFIEGQIGHNPEATTTLQQLESHPLVVALQWK